MQGIEFDEDKDLGGYSLRKVSKVTSEGKPSYMFKLLNKAGIEDKTTGNFILLCIAIVFFGITIFLYAGVLGNNIPSVKTAEQIQAQLRVMHEMQNIK
ncbi:MAG: hypothetical protein WC791_04610 [Candidatus Paceibacterota bacterium]|jgi:hypothetical protein